LAQRFNAKRGSAVIPLFILLRGVLSSGARSRALLANPHYGLLTDLPDIDTKKT
jgi:hypothetical protein